MSVRIILASASPRRAQLLRDAGVAFSVQVSEVDETLEPDLLAQPAEACKKLAERKAGAVVQEVLSDVSFVGEVAVLGSDTMVVLDDRIFGKPESRDHAHQMLSELSGRTHQVMTSASLWMVSANEEGQVSLGFRTFVDTTQVTFKQLADETIQRYLDTGESADKAGAYAIQGKGQALVQDIDGAWDTVVGLPVQRLLEEFPFLTE